ncbi:MAG: hypothetical protein K0R06_755 [Clostridium sp.]|jgi:hypothetical protein|nr:hypothetical protein [Clostridium sp.]
MDISLIKVKIKDAETIHHMQIINSNMTLVFYEKYFAKEV